ncbi:MAG: hypothetical protein ACFFG0_04140 [Candidatus Thorarchaeota archaeon]
MKKDLVIPSNKFDPIISKAGDVKSLTFRTIDEKALVEISEWMPEVNRAVSSFNKKNSQTTASLMQLNMVDSGPYRVLRQILAQVEKKRMALKDALYKRERKKLLYDELDEKILNSNGIERKKLELRQQKIGCDIIDSHGHIEGAVKELGALKRRYEEIRKNKGIPENWDEQDFEEAEIEHHIKSIFRNAIRDRLQGSHNMGTMEYMEQFGINPITAYSLVDDYIIGIKKFIGGSGKGPDISTHYNFYNRMYETFKDSYKEAMKNVGLDSITHADFLMKESK